MFHGWGNHKLESLNIFIQEEKNLLSLISQSREDGEKQMVGEITQDSELTFREHISQKMVECTGWFHSEL